jgi:hypothetical protein
VPRGGVTVLGKFLPEGTVVGGSPYVVNRHRGTFGDDAEFWRPERWLEKGDEHKRKLEQSMLTVRLSCCSLFVLCAQADDILLSQFGSGRRVCLGRHVGIMEIKKLISFTSRHRGDEKKGFSPPLSSLLPPNKALTSTYIRSASWIPKSSRWRIRGSSFRRGYTPGSGNGPTQLPHLPRELEGSQSFRGIVGGALARWCRVLSR